MGLTTYDNGVQPPFKAWVLKYDEDQWFRYSEEQQEHCKEEWRKKARCTEATTIILQLVPDPVFPRGEKEYPYIVWQEPLRPKPEKGFKVGARVSIKCDTPDMDVRLRRAIEMELIKYPAGTDYHVFYQGEDGKGLTLMEGKVRK